MTTPRVTYELLRNHAGRQLTLVWADGAQWTEDLAPTPAYADWLAAVGRGEEAGPAPVECLLQVQRCRLTMRYEYIVQPTVGWHGQERVVRERTVSREEVAYLATRVQEILSMA